MAVDTYLDVLDELRELTLKKRQGYSPGDDPFKNFRMSTQFGVDPLKGILVRVMDKLARVSSLIENPANDRLGESLRDNLLDAGNYLLIAVAYTDAEDEKRFTEGLTSAIEKAKAEAEMRNALSQEEARRWLSYDPLADEVLPPDTMTSNHDPEECAYCAEIAPEPEGDQTVGSPVWFVSGEPDGNPLD